MAQSLASILPSSAFTDPFIRRLLVRLRRPGLLVLAAFLAVLGVALLLAAVAPPRASATTAARSQPPAVFKSSFAPRDFLLAPLSGGATPVFLTRYFGGLYPTNALAVGDVNGDGVLDLVLGNGCEGVGYNCMPSRIFLGDGKGEFDSGSLFSGSDQTAAIALGDLNNDGLLDIVEGNVGSPSVDIFYNIDGQWTQATLGSTSNTTSIALGDLNGDGRLDIAQGNDGQLSEVYMNNGGGHWSSAPLGSVTKTVSIALGDLNGDGALDIVQGVKGASSRVFLNNGSGGFPANGTAYGSGFPDKTDPFNLALGDLNGDGALDIAQSDGLVFLNNGIGGFSSATAFEAVVDLWGPSMALGDMNGDGALDIVLAEDGVQSRLYLNLNDGTGRFGGGAPFGDRNVTQAVAVADLNGDGTLDVIQGNFMQSPAVYLNTNGIGFLPTVSLSNNSYAEGVALGDLNRDGALDIVQATSPGSVTIRLNGGMGNWVTATLNVSATDVAVGDFNGDGAPDIVESGSQGLLVSSATQGHVFLNDGAGRFYTGTVGDCASLPSTVRCLGYRPGSVYGRRLGTLALGDADGDGALDIVTGAGLIFLNAGPGQFYSSTVDCANAAALWPRVGCYGSSVDYPTLGDMNGDGALDIVDAIGNIYYNDGGGRFGPQVRFAAGGYSVAVGDLNGDGRLDIVHGLDGYQSRVYFSDGEGGFGSGIGFGGATSACSTALADLNGDGALDIVQGNCGGGPSQQYSEIYLNDGAGGFGDGIPFGYPANTESLAVGDLNGDGAPDVVQSDFGPGLTNIHINSLFRGASLPGSHLAVGVNRPLTPLYNANFVYTNTAQRTGSVPITYTLSDPASGPVRLIRAFFSPDGGGRWYTATAVSGTQITNLATFGRALQFDGVNDYVDLPDMNPNLAGGFTLEAWVYYHSIKSYSRIIELGNGPSSDNIIFYNTANSNDLSMVVYSSAVPGSVLTAPGALQTNQWMHLAATVDGSGQARLYKDGSLIASGIINRPRSLIRTINYMGRSSWPDDGYFDGQIDEVRIYDRPLSLAQIQANMRQPLTAGIDYLVAGWAFNESNGTTARDVSTNRYDGTLYNGPVRTLMAVPYVYNWDVVGSGFFGQSDNMVVRLEAYPTALTSTVATTASLLYPNATPSLLHPYAFVDTFPLRVRGTQVQVISGTQPVSNAVVYLLPEGQATGGDLIRDGSGVPFHTDSQGYLQGRGEIKPGDRLLAMAPVLTNTQGYALYYTNGIPQEVGVSAYTVTGGLGLQVIAVTAQHPLYFFDLNVSLEWDAHNDNAYLALLTDNLYRASQYLYDFTDGQAVLGDVFVFQNMAGWDASHIALYANNRLRPFAIIGGIVLTNTQDPYSSTIMYGPGRVTIGSTWNRYGRPGQMLGDDWSIILAHELSHYLFYQEDVYLGLDSQGKLKPVSSCTGSAMGDLYGRPQNTEFIFNSSYWSDNRYCGETLASKLLKRTEWQTLLTWYRAMVTPTVSTALAGPSEMPFGFTTVTVFDPLTPTDTLVDPTFYVNYADYGVPSADARAYLQQSDGTGEWLESLGSPGMQSQIVARGAQGGDRLCVFDSGARQYGCETVVFGDDQLQLTHDTLWNPVFRVTPINSTTLGLTVTNVPTTGLTLQAQLYPDGYYAPAAIFLTPWPAGNGYTGTFSLPQTGLVNGNIRVWASGRVSETVMVYSVGGNLGGTFAGGGSRPTGGIGGSRPTGGIGGSRPTGGIGGSRPTGGIGGSRPTGGIGGSRPTGGIGQVRSGHAPLLSPDGQMIYFTDANASFPAGALFTIQATGNLPGLPAGRTQVGPGYNLVASPNAALPDGSISVQYLVNDVQQVGAEETDLLVYFNTGTTWRVLTTTVDADFDQAVAPSQGPGLYALLASIKIPLPVQGWNSFGYPLREAQTVTDALASIAGQYGLVYGYDMTDLKDPWKVFKPNPPVGYVNDLVWLRFAQTCWVSTTVTNTLYLAPADVGANLYGFSPPATFYGVISATADFTPAAGQTVEAVLNGLLCGEGVTQEYNGDIVYVVDVNGNSDGAVPGCGQTGQFVTIYVDGQSMGPVGVWNNADLVRLNLAPVAALEPAVYLPLVRR